MIEERGGEGRDRKEGRKKERGNRDGEKQSGTKTRENGNEIEEHGE